MRMPTPSFSVHVDVTNPGQFFACCGLLELAHRLWPGAEGWFGAEGSLFMMRASADSPFNLKRIVEGLAKVGIEGELSSAEQEEFDTLESQKRALKRNGQHLSEQDEKRRSDLGKCRREGAIVLGGPFNFRLAWWQEDGDDIPKTFAGRQEVLRMAQAMRARLLEAADEARPFHYRCLLNAVSDEGQETGASKVEPFYFDALRFAHKLDAGFSLDVQEKSIRASAAPLTELLALVGLQRFRPRAAGEDRWAFEYFAWDQPIGAVAAAAVACGAVPMEGRRGYRFRLQFRDDQKRYKAFSFATPFGGRT